MRFVTDHLQKLQCGIVAIESDRFVAIRNVNLLFAFRESRDRDLLDAEFVERRERGVELSAAAVDQNEIGQSLFFFEQSSIATIDRFSHRSKIIGADDGLDIEDAVLVLVEFPAIENDHSGDRVRTLN